MNSLLIFVIFNILEDFILNEICEKEKPILNVKILNIIFITPYNLNKNKNILE